MMRTQISLDDGQRDALDREAARTGRSMAALIRDAIDAQYGTPDDPERDLAIMRRASGAWRDRAQDGAAWVDRHRSGSRLADARRDHNDKSNPIDNSHAGDTPGEPASRRAARHEPTPGPGR
jgi:hypothetical protein